jgi:hypothetical protein
MAKRRITAGTLRLNPTRALALTIGPMPGATREPEATLEAVYWRHRERLLSDVTPRTLPWAWWQYEGPPELRDELPALVPVERAAQHRADRDELDRRRAAWLAQHTR